MRSAPFCFLKLAFSKSGRHEKISARNVYCAEPAYFFAVNPYVPTVSPVLT